ncbi:MAG TPA: uracil phosphoribosyltransferase [Polyangiales bacterium]|nr:uracil phosphoribosyltransferase [Polyangiales bacterium]
MSESAYTDYVYRLPELAHGYGPNVHLLSDPVLLTQLARLCRADVVQPEITRLVRAMYRTLVQLVIANEFPREPTEIQTRMYESTKRAVWNGDVLDSTTRAVTVNIARAGTLPSQVAFETLIELLNPEKVRQDHVFIARVTDERGSVTGVSMSGSKIGGDVDDALVLFPDPMGATGGSLSHTVALYKTAQARPRKLLSLHLIVTPQFIARMQADHPEVSIYAIRLDRGMSSHEILQTGLGERRAEESGLNEVQYIVPGAGGVGELLNNSFV